MVDFEQVTDQDRASQNGYDDKPTIEDLFAAPSYTQLIKPAQSKTAKEYQDKTYALLKALLGGAINAGDYPDAAAILAYGPAFGAATGQLADSSERAAQLIDMLTTPANPFVM